VEEKKQVFSFPRCTVASTRSKAVPLMKAKKKNTFFFSFFKRHSCASHGSKHVSLMKKTRFCQFREAPYVPLAKANLCLYDKQICASLGR
jgi:hypothetical protein